MFTVGASYNFRVIEDGDEVIFWGIVEKYEHPLVKLKDVNPSEVRIQMRGLGRLDQDITIGGGDKPIPGRIINVTSSNFVSAVQVRSGSPSTTGG